MRRRHSSEQQSDNGAACGGQHAPGARTFRAPAFLPLPISPVEARVYSTY